MASQPEAKDFDSQQKPQYHSASPNTVAFNYSTLDREKLEFFEIAPASELPAGERLFVELGGKMIVIFNIAGAYYAIADVCSHDDGPVGEGDLAGYEVTCPRHGAGFDVRTGKVTKMPAVVDIPSYPVEVREGAIFVGLPRD